MPSKFQQHWPSKPGPQEHVYTKRKRKAPSLGPQTASLIRNRIKTHDIIYANPQQIAEQSHAWDLPGIQQRATLRSPTDELRTLGATLGGQGNRSKIVKAELQVTQAMRRTVATLNDPAVELKLAQQCLGESKVQHFLRLYGTDLMDALGHADQTIDTTLNRIATGLGDFGRKQAALGIRVGGMGLRQLQHLATPAELAAKITARPNIAELSQALTTAGLIDNGIIIQHLDSNLAQLAHKFQQTLD